MDKKKKMSEVEQERIKIAEKLAEWVNEDPSERACVCILSSGNTSSTVVAGIHGLCIKSTASAINNADSVVREIVAEAMMLTAMSRVAKE